MRCSRHVRYRPTYGDTRTSREIRPKPWVKVCANRGQELVIGGYIPGSRTFDSTPVGYYEGSDLNVCGPNSERLHTSFASEGILEFRGSVDLQGPFRNLPESGKGRWGDGLTAADMKKCRWLKPQLVAAIEFLEWTLDNHLRHARFVALQADKEARKITGAG